VTAALDEAAGEAEVLVSEGAPPELLELKLDVVVDGAEAGAFEAFSLNAAAVWVDEGFTARTAPWLHKPPA